MGSHYIPVGKIKIDKDILDIVCPAAGYDNTPPPPEIYCKANDYYPPNEPIFDPEGIPPVTPPSGTDEVILIISNQILHNVIARFITDTGNVLWELYGEGDVLIDSGSVARNTDFKYDLSVLVSGYIGAAGILYYKFIFRPLAGNELQSVTCGTRSLIEAYLNTPSLKTCSFSHATLTQKIWMCDVMDSFNPSGAIFSNILYLQSIRLPLSMNACENVSSWFRYTSVKEVVFPESMPSLKTLQYLFADSGVEKTTLPIYIFDDDDVSPAINAKFLFQNANKIKEIRIEFNTRNRISFDWAIENNPQLRNLYISPTANLENFQTFLKNNVLTKINNGSVLKLDPTHNNLHLNMSNVLENNFMIKKIIIGDVYNIGSNAFCTLKNSVVEEIVLPSELTLTGTAPTNMLGTNINTNLKKIILPKKLYFPNIYNNKLSSFFLNNNYFPNLEEITTIDEVDFLIANPSVIPLKIKIFDQPSFVFYTNIDINKTFAAPGNLEYFDIDFEQSFIEGCSTSVNFSYQQLDTVELDRIFTKFPDSSVATGSGGKRVTITGNPGAATCDRSILTNKNWSVTG